MQDLTKTLIEAAQKVIDERFGEDFCTLLIITDFNGEITTHRFDVQNLRNGKPEKRKAVDCRRGATRFMDCIVSSYVSGKRPDGLYREDEKWDVRILTETRNANKDLALYEAMKANPIVCEQADFILFCFRGHTKFDERYFQVKNGQLVCRSQGVCNPFLS